MGDILQWKKMLAQVNNNQNHQKQTNKETKKQQQQQQSVGDCCVLACFAAFTFKQMSLLSLSIGRSACGAL